MSKSGFRVAAIVAHLSLAAVPAAAQPDEPRNRASDAALSQANAAPKTPSLAPLIAIGVGVLLAAGLSHERTPVRARAARR